MLKEIIQEKDGIIDHIELKLAKLREQRSQIEKSKYAKDPVPMNSNLISSKPIKFNRDEKLQVQNNLQQLEKLYLAKKQLRKIGITTNDPNQIQKYQNDPKWIQYAQRKKKLAIQKAEKQKIIQQQMVKTKLFLASKKVSNMLLGQLQEMNYRSILKKKLEELDKYHNIVTKTTLNRLEKQDLILMTFQMLKEYNKVVKKDVLKGFLLANSEFCGHFHITHQEITRDLEVHETQQEGVLNYIEFIQFVKSIEITSLHMNPSLANKAKKQKEVMENLMKGLVINQTVTKDEKANKLNEREIFRKLVQYLRKVFKNFDRGNESIVDRSKFISALQKGMYWDALKDKEIGKEELKNFANFIALKTKQKGSKSYYKQLDSKFINWGQIDQYSKLFRQDKLKKATKQQNIQVEPLNSESITLNNQENSQGQSFQPQQQDQFQYSQSTQFDLSQKQGKVITQKDYQRYGWSHNHEPKEEITYPHSKINQIDSYYKQVGQKYFAEIAWGEGFDEFKPDFKQLEAFIKMQEMKKHGQLHQQSHKNAENLSKIVSKIAPSKPEQEKDKKQWAKY